MNGTGCTCCGGQGRERRRGGVGRAVRKLVTWAVIGVAVAEWWGRGGREFLLGDADDSVGIGEEFTGWIPLPPRTPEPESGVPGPIMKEGEQIGWIYELRKVEDARDMAGHDVERFEVYVEVARAKVGYPINVALAEIEMLVCQALYP